ncbi:MAG: DNA-3-methyladenine glycosylase I [Pseudomonadales bacterium]|jgi:DNA-3-methyladenine glycosylase I|nr:DNA-3-methyladenine glycosylase I [Pseudomonadales bacterium]MDP4639719.1 DNA-3-methyladenine glycosylase I [Pseudomonadales bacterium]MDP4874632.1 DNA-3-methyladenine glycosylase I [Pseudomonadales bacterium]MDP4910401.1 DNA-3-methyladenine glycosylase I [Pseudomonadales bacterium]MDP5059368.1 DNA-3-methyladenine glycosylase I [Pseudomonadales bacterium]
MATTELQRCGWCQGEQLYRDYHDQVWGLPEFNDQMLFEFLLLEGAQAGLSWITILRKREHYRQAFDGFDPVAIADYGDVKQAELLQNPGIIRNRLKIASASINARSYLHIVNKGRSFADYLWDFVDGTPVQNHYVSLADVPANTPTSDAMSKRLKADGFKFVGTTICYAFMQATGMVNDHLLSCYRHEQCAAASTQG